MILEFKLRAAMLEYVLAIGLVLGLRYTQFEVQPFIQLVTAPVGCSPVRLRGTQHGT